VGGRGRQQPGVTLGAQPLRIAACKARHALIDLGSRTLNVRSAELEARDALVRMKSSPENGVSRSDWRLCICHQPEVAETTSFGPKMKAKSPLNPPGDYRVVGNSIPRFDVPAKVTGVFEFVHKVRLPDMLHSRVAAAKRTL
jgi:nicotinate dehydrogenase subunit B